MMMDEGEGGVRGRGGSERGSGMESGLVDLVGRMGGMGFGGGGGGGG